MAKTRKPIQRAAAAPLAIAEEKTEEEDKLDPLGGMGDLTLVQLARELRDGDLENYTLKQLKSAIAINDLLSAALLPIRRILGGAPRTPLPSHEAEQVTTAPAVNNPPAPLRREFAVNAGELPTQILGVLPRGKANAQTVGQIVKALELSDSKPVSLALKTLVQQGKVKTEGERRGMKYFQV